MMKSILTKNDLILTALEKGFIDITCLDMVREGKAVEDRLNPNLVFMKSKYDKKNERIHMIRMSFEKGGRGCSFVDSDNPRRISLGAVYS